ncbi:hypothetical protein [Candidatus Electronema sp. JM]|uniref:hypothetical protein n=1 Tax=Candidatus Electronema sp. JM TaxID=3401571 RepID=UPI003AA9DACD
MKEEDLFGLGIFIAFGTFFISLFPKLSLLAYLSFAFYAFRQHDHDPSVRPPAGECQESH